MPRYNIAVVARADFEPATHVGSMAIGTYERVMAENGMIVFDIHGDVDTRENVIRYLKLYDPVFFMGLGHGSPTIFTGQNKEKIFWVCHDSELRGRVVYLFSCSTGAELGKDIVSKGARAFIGYTEEFVWSQMDYRVSPLEDPIGVSFFRPALSIADYLSRGYTVQQAYTMAKEEFKKQIDRWRFTPTILSPLVLSQLIQDYNALVFYGDGNAKVVPWFKPVPKMSGLWLLPVVALSFIAVPMIAGTKAQKF